MKPGSFLHTTLIDLDKPSISFGYINEGGLADSSGYQNLVAIKLGICFRFIVGISGATLLSIVVSATKDKFRLVALRLLPYA